MRAGGPLPTTHDKTQAVLFAGVMVAWKHLSLSVLRHFHCTFDSEKIIADLIWKSRNSISRKMKAQ